jgi:serine/threonine protein kinase
MDPFELCPGCFRAMRTAGVCSVCSYDSSVQLHSYFLTPYTDLRGKYLIGRVLGKPGGFGITYLAWDRALSTQVAIKEYFPRDIAGRNAGDSTIQPMHATDPELYQKGLQQFVTEAQTLAGFKHANIIGVNDIFRENNTAYIVMDYHPGNTLQEYVDERGGSLPVNEALPILRQVLEGLREVHKRNLLHRDIKPQNLYRASESGLILLLDFGAARSVLSFDGRTVTVIFAPDFAAPEQQMLRGELGPCSDIYGVGATLFYLLTGTVLPPLSEHTKRRTVASVQAAAPLIPNTIAALIARCVEIEAPKRYQTADELIAVLDELIAPPAVHPVESPATGPTKPKRSSNHVKISTGHGTLSDHGSSNPIKSVLRPPQRPEISQGGNRTGLFAVIVSGLLLVIIFGVVWLLLSRGEETVSYVEVTHSPYVMAPASEEPPATESSGNEDAPRRPAQRAVKPGNTSPPPSPPRTSSSKTKSTFPYSRTRFVELVMEHDLAFDRNTHKESEKGIRIILSTDEETRSKKFRLWRQYIPRLDSFSDSELEKELRNLFYGQ